MELSQEKGHGGGGATISSERDWAGLILAGSALFSVTAAFESLAALMLAPAWLL